MNPNKYYGYYDGDAKELNRSPVVMEPDDFIEGLPPETLSSMGGLALFQEAQVLEFQPHKPRPLNSSETKAA